MSLDEPHWWYGTEPRDRRMQRLLAPASRLYGFLSRRRIESARHPYRPASPVVCIGNFTAGGTGKTPLALAIARQLSDLGCEPVFLTRGYRGSIEGPHWIIPQTDTAAGTGDEPRLLARAAPVMIARDRRRGAEAIDLTPPSRGARDLRVIVMDDGLQNPAVAKDLAIALVDGKRGLGNGSVIPAGPLRAPLATQLDLAHCVVVNRGTASPDEETDIERQFRRSFKGPVLAAFVAPAGDTSWLKERPVLAYAGIANPDRFFNLVEAEGGALVARRAFPDHHAFTENDAARLLAEATARGASLVTTDKDVVRLDGGSGARSQLREASRTLSIELRFDGRNAARLTALLSALLTAQDHSHSP